MRSQINIYYSLVIRHVDPELLNCIAEQHKKGKKRNEKCPLNRCNTPKKSNKTKNNNRHTVNMINELRAITGWNHSAYRAVRKKNTEKWDKSIRQIYISYHVFIFFILIACNPSAIISTECRVHTPATIQSVSIWVNKLWMNMIYDWQLKWNRFTSLQSLWRARWASLFSLSRFPIGEWEERRVSVFVIIRFIMRYSTRN